MEQTHVTLMDATCYESHLRYPTAVKLLWESIGKVYELMQQKRKLLKLRGSRSNYDKHKKAVHAISAKPQKNKT